MSDETLQVSTPDGAGDFKSGSTLGSYEIVGLLGKGAMGRVYRARHLRLGREVALKVLNPEFVAQPDVVQRFFREARIVNEIDHKNIVEVTDFVERPGLAYLVMELLEGESVRDLMDRRGRKYPQLKRIVAILTQVCAALEAAHAKNVVHRDLKPDNVFVIKRDGADFVKVLDFGVAKLRGGGDLAATTTGMIIGTPHYMAPEQALGREVSRAADIWAAGVVLYELLAGCRPFAGESFIELAMQIREKPPKPLPSKTPRGERIPPWVAAVVLRCLEKKPADRYRSMTALAEALSERGVDTSRRLPRKLVAVVAGLAAGVTLAVFAVRAELPTRTIAALERARSALRAPAERPPAPPPTPAAVTTKEAKPQQAAPSPPPAQPSTPQPPPPPAKRAAAPVERPAARAVAPAPRPPTIELVLRSTPPGARVVRLDTGERLGRTPLRADVPRKAATVWLQMTLDGHQPIKFTVDLRRDNTANVTFQSAKPPARRR